VLGYIFVAVVAGAVGWGVYRLVLRYGPGDPTPMAETMDAAPSDVDEWRGGSERPIEQAEPSTVPVDGAYLPVAPSAPSWQSRAAGLMGLVISVIVAAVTLAFVVYSAGHLIAKLMSHAASG
jgi:hypothetical protein